MRYVQVHRAEYHSLDDWDALQEARKQYGEVEKHVRLEEEDKNERGEIFEGRDSSEDDERPYEVLNFENVRKIRKRPGAPKWTIRLSKALQDCLKKPAKADERSLANAIWRIMMKMDRGGETFLKEKWRKKQKKEKKKRRTRSARRPRRRPGTGRRAGDAGRGTLSRLVVGLRLVPVIRRRALRPHRLVAAGRGNGKLNQRVRGRNMKWKSELWIPIYNLSIVQINPMGHGNLTIEETRGGGPRAGEGGVAKTPLPLFPTGRMSLAMHLNHAANLFTEA